MAFNVYFTVKVLVLLLSTSLLFTFSKAHDHFHEHDAHHHSDESPSTKYSEKANAEYIAKTKHNVIHDHDHRENIKQNLDDVWMYAIASTLFISAAPALVLFVIPIDNTEKTQPLLKVLLAFASGGLLGDAFLHLIPHAALAVASEGSHTHHSHTHDDTEEHQHDMSVGLGVLAGIITFLIIDKGVRIIKGNSSKHGHSHVIAPSQNDKNDGKKKKLKNKNLTDEDSNVRNISHTKDINVSGYLNLAADFSHNFTDGLAIGASYLAGNSIGIVTTVTILLHEVPHEIGDFAILLQSGVSRRNAILLQLSTALGALAGTVLSLITKEGVAGFGTNWVLPFTAGGFIYIALVSVIPELLDEEKPTLLQTFLQVIAMFGGVFMMILIAEYE